MSSFEKVVKNACKPKHAPPKAKYLDPIIAATWSEDGAIHDVCRALAPRFREPNATVVFKALLVLHTMIRNGATDKVLAYLSSSEILRLRNVGSSQWEGYKAPENLQAYAVYLDARIRAYKDIKHDAIRVQSESNRDARLSHSLEEDGQRGHSSRNKKEHAPPAEPQGLGRSKTVMGRKLRVMSVEKGLLRETRVVQKTIDALVACQFYRDDLEDELNISALRMLVKDLLILFQAGNEGVINVLEHYFEMSHVDAEQALAIYRNFCKQAEYVVEYLGVAKKLQNLLNVPIPNLKHAPVSLVKSLEEYLNDPNFEQNRIEYKANKDAADRSVRNGTTAPSKSTEPASQPSSSTSEPPKQETKAFSDFFSAIEEEQTPMFNPATNSPTANYFAQQAGFNPFTAQPTGFQPQPNAFLQPQFTAVPGPFGQPQQPFGQPTGLSPFAQQALQPQVTGNPFRPQTMVFPDSTGLPFGAGGSNPFPQQPQQTGLNPFPQQNGANPFPQQNGSNPFPQQNGTNPFPGLAPQPTGAPNPFPTQPTGNPFPTQPTGFQANGSNPFPSFSNNPFPASQSSIAPQATGFNTASLGGGIARPASTPLNAFSKPSSPPPQPVKTHATGSRNPFGAPKAPSPPPVPKAPTLLELGQSKFAAYHSQGPPGHGQQQQQNQQQQPLQSQQTGFVSSGIGSIASSFLTGTGGAVKPDEPTGSTATTTTGASLFGVGSALSSQGTGATSLFSTSTGAGAFGTGASAFSSSAGSPVNGSSSPPLQPQSTGFTGLKAFKPSSSFGASLLESLPSIPQSQPSTPAAQSPPPGNGTTSPFGLGAGLNGGAGLNSSASSPALGNTTGVGLRPQATGLGAGLGAGGVANPFRASMFPATGGPGAPGGAGASLFSQPTGLPNGSAFGAGAGAGGFGAGAGGFGAGAGGFGAGSGGFGASLFGQQGQQQQQQQQQQQAQQGSLI
ncbi:ANTH-domain-containing protein [Peniophora sp. CONT]|nr:ANTH-domain-containing protein [Peniophora sp. CONT]